MKQKLKNCRKCGKEFNIKDKNRIVLEGWRNDKHLFRLYFCSRKCFVDFLHEKKIV